jgi:uncharacterized protein YjbI with pentapeptide repeats
VVVVEVNGHTIEPGANLSGADLSGHPDNARQTDLTDAILSGADLTEANLEGTRANEDTTWPQGFDPKAAGVIFK